MPGDIVERGPFSGQAGAGVVSEGVIAPVRDACPQAEAPQALNGGRITAPDQRARLFGETVQRPNQGLPDDDPSLFAAFAVPYREFPPVQVDVYASDGQRFTDPEAAVGAQQDQSLHPLVGML